MGLGFHGYNRGWVVNDNTTWVSVLIIERSKRWDGLSCEYRIFSNLIRTQFLAIS
jgi:hypothetical protein